LLTGTCVHSAMRRSTSAITSSCCRLKNIPSLVRILDGTLFPVELSTTALYEPGAPEVLGLRI
jgi:hypothetical protein